MAWGFCDGREGEASTLGQGYSSLRSQCAAVHLSSQKDLQQGKQAGNHSNQSPSQHSATPGTENSGGAGLGTYMSFPLLCPSDQFPELDPHYGEGRIRIENFKKKERER